jgi:hypothetical protein
MEGRLSAKYIILKKMRSKDAILSNKHSGSEQFN